MAVTDSFVDGHALRAMELLARTSSDAADLVTSRTLQEIATGAYPRVEAYTKARAGWSPELSAAWMDESFEEGVRALLDGFVLRYAGPS